MPPKLRQLVTFSDCKSCGQCCKFDAIYRNFAPLIDSSEKNALLRGGLLKKSQVAPLGEGLHKIALVENKGEGGGLQCSCLGENMVCSIQKRKPFDCLLYPYVLMASRSGKEVFMMRDESCPGIAKRKGSASKKEYEAYLRRVFLSKGMRMFLESNAHVIERYQKNLKKVFRVIPQ